MRERAESLWWLALILMTIWAVGMYFTTPPRAVLFHQEPGTCWYVGPEAVVFQMDTKNLPGRRCLQEL